MRFARVTSEQGEPVHLNFEMICWVQPMALLDSVGNKVDGSRVWFVGGTKLDILLSPPALMEMRRW